MPRHAGPSEGVEVIDAAGKTVLPGLDRHPSAFPGNLTDDDTDWVMQPPSRSRPSPSSRPTTASPTVSPTSATGCLWYPHPRLHRQGRLQGPARSGPPASASAALPATATPPPQPGASTRNRTPGASGRRSSGTCVRPSVVACARTRCHQDLGYWWRHLALGLRSTSNYCLRRSRPSKRPSWSASPCGATTVKLRRLRFRPLWLRAVHPRFRYR